jgi:hypothetical protein
VFGVSNSGSLYAGSAIIHLQLNSTGPRTTQ